MILMSVTSALRRVHYQRAMDSMKSGKAVSQRLLIPASIKLDRADADFYETNKKAFKACGFDIEEFGPNFTAYMHLRTGFHWGIWRDLSATL